MYNLENSPVCGVISVFILSFMSILESKAPASKIIFFEFLYLFTIDFIISIFVTPGPIPNTLPLSNSSILSVNMISGIL